MAKQLLANRTPQAYAAVERFAKAHSGTEAGALGWLVLGFARSAEADYPAAIAALTTAKADAGELGDYVDHQLATAQRASGQFAEAARTLEGFSERHRDSLFERDAALLQAYALLSNHQAAKAAQVLSPHRTSGRADIELAFGKAMEALGKRAEAIDAYERVYVELPTSNDAGEAKSRLTALDASYQISAERRKQRADLLLKARKFSMALEEFRQLANEPSLDRQEMNAMVAFCQLRLNRDGEAKRSAASIGEAKGETEALRLYVTAEIARKEEDMGRHRDSVVRLREQAPESFWLQEALLSAGNMYLLRKDFREAAAFYDELAARFPQGRFGSSAHWKGAWLKYRMGKKAEARQGFLAHIKIFPASGEVPNALYWSGRLAEEQGELPKARGYYQKLSDRFRNYYYAGLARERLRAIKVSPIEEDAVLAGIPSAESVPADKFRGDAENNLRYQKARLLNNAGLTELAVKELQAAARQKDGAWAAVELAKLYQEDERPHTALQTLKRAVPSYFAQDVNALPRPVMEGLFPRPYWQQVKSYSTANGLDPYLVAALIRQESEFNPGAVSHANAYGLMQLLPSVGKKVAREVKMRPYSKNSLLQPTPNIILGTRFFRTMVDQNEGRVEYALAAYNAGQHRVNDWMDDGDFKDVPEFVESIPFTETREYVQAIMRNVSVYKRLYGESF